MKTTLKFNKTYVHIHSLNETNGDCLLVVYRKNVTIGSSILKAKDLSLLEITFKAIHICKVNSFINTSIEAALDIINSIK